MKRIVIGGEWLNTFPLKERGDIIKMIFSLANQFGYEIVISGQKWPK